MSSGSSLISLREHGSCNHRMRGTGFYLATSRLSALRRLNTSVLRRLNMGLWFQEQLHQSGLDAMLRAERQSLLTELQQLQSRLSQLRCEQQDLQAQMTESLAQQEETATNKTWKLQREGTSHPHRTALGCHAVFFSVT